MRGDILYACDVMLGKSEIAEEFALSSQLPRLFLSQHSLHMRGMGSNILSGEPKTFGYRSSDGASDPGIGLHE